MNIENNYDQQIIKRRVGKIRFFFYKNLCWNLLSAFIERAKERGYIDSYSYHELHALKDRLFE